MIQLLQYLVKGALLSGILYQSATIVTFLITGKVWSHLLKERGWGYWIGLWLIPMICHSLVCLMLAWQNYAPFCVSGLIMLGLYAADYVFLEGKRNKTGWRRFCHMLLIPHLQVFLTATVFIGLK